jgi:hypothetical protein
MKIIKPAREKTVVCKLCGCEFVLTGKAWRKVTHEYYDYKIKCPTCNNKIVFIPGEDVQCKK